MERAPSQHFAVKHPTKSRRRTISLQRLMLAALVFFYVGLQLYLTKSFATSPDINLFQTDIQPDAYFNKFPVRLRDRRYQEQLHQESFHSSVHCVGETHDPATAWKHRSCTYVNLCIDLGGTSSGDNKGKGKPEFFLVASNAEKEFQNHFRGASATSKFRYSSTEILKSENNNPVQNSKPDSMSYSPIDVALGGINPLWRAGPTKNVPYEIGIDKNRWAPKVYDQMPSEKYYELDPSVVVVPYYSFAGANAGHLLWDDFLPLFNLLRIFGYEKIRKSAPKQQQQKQQQQQQYEEANKGYQHLLIRVNTMPQMFGSCDIRAKKKEACRKNLERLLPLFGVAPDTFSTLTDARLQAKEEGQADPPLYPICAKRAVAGLGWLTDHGIRNHGWMANNEEDSLDIALAHNVGRGPELYSFRNFMLRNIGFKASSSGAVAAPIDHSAVTFRILLSAYTSNHPDRNFGLQQQKNALHKAFPNAEVSVLELSSMPLQDQISLVVNEPKIEDSTANGELRSLSQGQYQQHTIFVSACGGGSLTAFFLPRGSSLILYYNEVGGMNYFNNEEMTGGQALLDWDLMNNLGYLKVHWLPIGSMDEKEGLDALVSLVQHEMDGVLNGLMFG